MYSLLKKIIPEKDMLRQIALLEQLLNQTTMTTKELAQELQTTDRTLFSDLQRIRDQLPHGWSIASSHQGIQLISEDAQLANDVLATFLPQSIGIQLIKDLLFSKELNTTHFLAENGLSFETLKRQVTKMNRKLAGYHLKIKSTMKTIQLIGEESAIRVFYHRLLMPFTHNNYFFNDYSIHEEHYLTFLHTLKDSALAVDTEQIFGVCWFFINVIRNKAQCAIESFSFNADDPLFALYREQLTASYQTEGVYLQETEQFFAFFCFLESWNYNNHFGTAVTLTKDYPALAEVASQLTARIATPIPMSFENSAVTENFLLLLIKYHESTWLSEQFQLEYQELLKERRSKIPTYEEQTRLALLEPVLKISEPSYFLNLVSLLAQQAFYALEAKTLTVYFVFQGEPAWKAFLQQELSDLIGRRGQLIPLEVGDVATLPAQQDAFIIANVQIEHGPLEVLYISSNPTKNERRQLTELILQYYL